MFRRGVGLVKRGVATCKVNAAGVKGSKAGVKWSSAGIEPGPEGGCKRKSEVKGCNGEWGGVKG